MIGTIEVVPTMIKNGVITDEKEIIGKYVNDDTVISKGSLFFKNMITESYVILCFSFIKYFNIS